jgi:hypothetical protein
LSEAQPQVGRALADIQAEEKYGTPERSLFAGGKAFARFFNLWADNDLGDQVKLLFAPWVSIA